MSTSFRLSYPIVALLTIASVARAEPTLQELQAQIDQLTTRIEQLQTSAPPAFDPRDVDATVAQVLADAEDRRAALASVGGFTAGYSDGKFVIRSEDGRFSLSPGFLYQFRYVADFRGNGKSNGNDDTESGFEMRRLKLNFSGNAFSKDVTYLLRTETDRSTGLIFLQDAWVRDQFAKDWSWQIGQFKDPVYHEERVSDGLSLAVEKSLVNALLSGGQTDRIVGATLSYDPGNLLVEGAFHDGFNSDNSPFNAHPGTSIMPGGTNFGISGRAEYFFAGRKSREYDRLSAVGNKEDLLVVGGGFDWSQGGDNNIVFHDVDVQWAPQSVRGLCVFGSLVGLARSIGDAGAGTIPGGDYYDYGFVAQAAYLLTDKFEIFGRYDFTKLDSGAQPAGTETDISEFTAGCNYYLHGENVKVTADINWLPNGCPQNTTSLGYLAGKDNQLIFRAQVVFAL